MDAKEKAKMFLEMFSSDPTFDFERVPDAIKVRMAVSSIVPMEHIIMNPGIVEHVVQEVM